MRPIVSYALVCVALAAVVGCAPQAIDMSIANGSYQCTYMKDICREAMEFEAKYERMPREEQKEMRTVLLTYRSQCSDAVKLCGQTNTPSRQK